MSGWPCHGKAGLAAESAGDYEACEGKSAGDQASLTGRNGETITGTCVETNDGLALRPDKPMGGPQGGGQGGPPQGGQDVEMQGGGRPGPPPEAYSACEGKSQGDEAEFTGRNGETVSGVCEFEGDSLVLKPLRK